VVNICLLGIYPTSYPCSALDAYHFIFYQCFTDPPDLHSFPTRRSSDLQPSPFAIWLRQQAQEEAIKKMAEQQARQELGDRATYRSEEHTSELQSPCNLVCRLLLEKKKAQRQP